MTLLHAPPPCPRRRRDRCTPVGRAALGVRHLRRRERGRHGELRGRRARPPRRHANPAADIVLLDTQYLFAETLVVRRGAAASASTSTCASSTRCPRCSPTTCGRPTSRRAAHVRKVEPLQPRAGRQGGVGHRRAPRRRPDPGQRARSSATTSAATSSRSTRWRRGPTTTWRCTPSSTTCRPTRSASVATRRSAAGRAPARSPPGEDKRAGRWSGNAKTECGLHV